MAPKRGEGWPRNGVRGGVLHPERRVYGVRVAAAE